MKVLLIDDEEELISTLAERLSFRGIEADWVTTGEEAMKKVAAQCYDLAVVDIRMPKMSGLELKKIMAEKCPRLKFIFMTGHGSEDDYKEGTAEAGAAYYLVKPVTIELLIEKINEALREKEASHEQ
ncbi:MAG: response regulator [Deltaproteobacteria bacterium]|nr:response regulator [Deltaproteobacteria bacterium]MBW2117758.1 response regulator [Deltaproteobacteria bacterium]MBW2344085.1 response regulator [Deltaproteobacteria bacterium]